MDLGLISLQCECKPKFGGGMICYNKPGLKTNNIWHKDTKTTGNTEAETIKEKVTTRTLNSKIKKKHFNWNMFK